ncbi:hypothetical protein, partial [Enterococcus faecium]|uniref:hypothetical protein n=1 Tax=Enterococcus faecium TaxID=1352 RepID=UPI001C54FBF4
GKRGGKEKERKKIRGKRQEGSKEWGRRRRRGRRGKEEDGKRESGEARGGGEVYKRKDEIEKLMDDKENQNKAEYLE